VELTSVELPAGVEQPAGKAPQRIATLTEALCALRRAADCCTLLSNQSGIIANTACLRATMLVDLFTRVVPLPLPIAKDVSCPLQPTLVFPHIPPQALTKYLTRLTSIRWAALSSRCGHLMTNTTLLPLFP
jgi:hypothetical protein